MEDQRFIYDSILMMDEDRKEENPRVSQLLNEFKTKIQGVPELAELSNYLNQPDRHSDLKKVRAIQQRLLNHKQQNTKDQYLKLNAENKWLKKKGRAYLISMDLEERQQMKKLFLSLDTNSKGYIGLDQLEEMMLSLGIATSNEEVKELMETVDEDHSGKIQFEEFLQMIRGENEKNAGIISFFKELMINSSHEINSLMARLRLTKALSKRVSNGPTQAMSEQELIREQLSGCPKGIPFEMMISQIRRSHILSSLSIGRCRTKENQNRFNRIQKGKEVVSSLQKMEERRLIRGFGVISKVFQSYNK